MHVSSVFYSKRKKWKLLQYGKGKVRECDVSCVEGRAGKRKLREALMKVACYLSLSTI